jgi:4-amino-4-deoxy-L-arabinose transferase-like glycosyltransferase
MSRWGKWMAIVLLIAFTAYFHFYKLTYLPFRVWDEARLANSAYEMTKSGNLIVTTIGNNPDIISTKPPLMIWAQVACIKLFGFSEFAIRIPAAMCATLTVILVFLFVLWLTHSFWSGLASAIVLCTAYCYLFDHSTRYGEYDSMLTFFIASALTSLFLFTETNGEKRGKWLLLFFFCLSLAALTKGVAALLYGPAVFIYLLLCKQLKAAVFNKYFLAGTLLFIFLVGGFYVVRELKSPGYLQAVFEQELGGRFNTVIEGHCGPWSYYWDYLKGEGFGNWYWALPVSLCLFWFFPNRRLFRATGFFLLMAIGMLTLISFGKTKLEWYVLPAIPLFAIVIGVLIDQISGAASSILRWQKEVLAVIFLIIFSIQPTVEAFDNLNNLWYDLSKDNFYAPSYYLRDATEGKRDLHGYIYLTGCYDLPWRLYVYRLNELGVNMPCVEYWSGPHLKSGDKIVANFSEAKKYVEDHYQYRLIEDFYGVRNYVITGTK